MNSCNDTIVVHMFFILLYICRLSENKLVFIKKVYKMEFIFTNSEIPF